MIITINNRLHLPLNALRPDLVEELKGRLSFKNPAYAEAVWRLKAQGVIDPRPFGVPKEIKGWQQYGNEFIIPRGCTSELLNLLKERGLDYQLKDLTRRLPPVDFTFHGKLKPTQEDAVKAMLGKRFSTLCSPTGSGKTVMGLYLIAQRRQPTIIIVHTAALMRQWAERVERFLGIPPSEIGYIGQGSKRVGKRVTIALVQTLRKCAKEIAPKVGHLIVDECHHTPASIFRGSVEPFDCYFMTGLSATHARRDDLTSLIYWYIGPLAYEVAQKDLIRAGDIIQVEPIIRETSFQHSPGIDPVWERAVLIAELTADEDRNNMIARDVAAEALRGGACIVLTDRKAHCRSLFAKISTIGKVNVAVCTGETPRDEQEQIVQQLNNGRIQVLIATGQLLGEGFDCRRLTALFLATPIKFSGRLIQYLGRVARSSEGKTTAKVYDYWDINVPVLMRAARERQRTYNKMTQSAHGPTPKKDFGRRQYK